MSSSLRGERKFRGRNIHITDIVRYRLPIPGVVSILHRVSGALLFFIIPIVLWLFGKSLSDQVFFESAIEFLRTPFSRFVSIVLFWSFAHHILAGVRFLMLDFHWGVDKSTARVSALLVFVLAMVLTVAFSFWMFS